jgi:hypothetical protein
MEKSTLRSQEDIVYNENVVPDDVPSIDPEISTATISPSIASSLLSKNNEVEQKSVVDVIQDPNLPKAEGLHAWLVIFSAFLCNVVTYGIGTSW